MGCLCCKRPKSNAKIADEYVHKIKTQTEVLKKELKSIDFDEDGTIVINPPAVNAITKEFQGLIDIFEGKPHGFTAIDDQMVKSLQGILNYANGLQLKNVDKEMGSKQNNTPAKYENYGGRNSKTFRQYDTEDISVGMKGTNHPYSTSVNETTRLVEQTKFQQHYKKNTTDLNDNADCKQERQDRELHKPIPTLQDEYSDSNSIVVSTKRLHVYAIEERHKKPVVNVMILDPNPSGATRSFFQAMKSKLEEKGIQLDKGDVKTFKTTDLTSYPVMVLCNNHSRLLVDVKNTLSNIHSHQLHQIFLVVIHCTSKKLRSTLSSKAVLDEEEDYGAIPAVVDISFNKDAGNNGIYDCEINRHAFELIDNVFKPQDLSDNTYTKLVTTL